MTVYSTHQWRQDGKARQRTNPRCADCGDPATVRDHVPPRRILVAAGIHNPDHPRWLRDRCKRCHDSKTRLIDAPLLARLDRGDDAAALADEAMRIEMHADAP